MKITSTLLLSLLCLQLYACKGNTPVEVVNHSKFTANRDAMKLKVTVDSKVFTATLHNNETVTAFKAKLPLTIKMRELNGNEKFGDFPTKAANPGTIQAGELMLYGSSTLVLLYKTFSTSYSYTRLERIDDVT
jgi:hypothetical protein